MRKLYKYLMLSFCLLTMAEALGQQVTLFNTSITNPYSINPAKAGENGNQFFLQHRNQWVGISGAPENSLLTTEWRLKESKAAIGFKLQYDLDNIVSATSAYFTYAYHTNLGGKHSLSAGLSFGVRNNSIRFDKILVEDDSDPTIFGYNQSGSKFDGDFGFSYKYDKFELQFSAIQLFATSATYFNSELEESFEYQYLRNYVASAAYTFTQVQDFEFTPILQVRGMQGFDLQPEFILKTKYLNQFMVSAHYLHKRSVAFGIGLDFQDIFTVSYAAEISTHELSAYNGATHEIVFGIKFGNAFERTETKRQLNKMKKSTNTYDERLEYLKRENDKLKKQVENQQEYYEQMKNGTNNKTYEELKQDIEDLKKAQEEFKANPSQGSGTQEQQELKQLLEENADAVKFDKGYSSLKRGSYDFLDEVALALNQNTELQIIVEGHSDYTGNDEDNLKLSENRANSVKDYLENEGVNSNQIQIIGKGTSEPIADNNTARGRKANRRVEIKMLF